MPRVRKPKCRSRTSAMTLDSSVEWSLCFWKGIQVDGMGADTPEALRVAWNVHKGDILNRFIEQCPGMRPYALYATGQIALPEMVCDPYPNDIPHRTAAGLVHETRCYGGYLGLFEHLCSLGIVPDEEQKLARKMFKKNPSRTPYTTYEFLSV